MKKTLGIVLVVVGIIMMVYSGFNYVTTEKVVDLGPIEINAEKSHAISIPNEVANVKNNIKGVKAIGEKISHK